MAHTRQSRPDSGLGFQVNALATFQVVSFSLGGGGLEETSAGGRVATGASVTNPGLDHGRITSIATHPRTIVHPSPASVGVIGAPESMAPTDASGL
jgi:hypothetical protein